MGKFVDLSGEKFGMLTVVSRHSTAKNGDALWLCKCECGGETITRRNALKNGQSKSCGCLKISLLKQSKTHGLSRDPIYRVWSSMIQRCNNPKSTHFSSYGGRGITVCDRWLDFGNFINDMGNRPSKDYSIDRIDNNSGYRPDNCRWSLREDQMANMRSNRFISSDDRFVPIFKASKAKGIPSYIVRNRLRANWGEAEALDTPIHRRIISTPKGDMRLSEAARTYGLSKHVLHLRLSRGWSIERAISTPVRKKAPNKKPT